MPNTSAMPDAVDTFTDPRKVKKLQDAIEQMERVTVGPTHRNVMGHASYDPIAADNSAAIQAVMDAGPGVVVGPPTANLKTATTIEVPSNVTFDGAPGGAVDWALGEQNGPTFEWTGATNGVVVKFFNAQHAGLRGFGIDGGGIAGVTAVLIDSDNTPSSWFVVVEDFYIQRCGVETANLGVNGYGIRVGQSLANSYQLDKIAIRHGEIRGSYKGISLESDNAMHGGIIDQVNFVNCSYDIDIQACGQFAIKRCIMTGLSVVFIHFRTRWNPVLIESCQTEGVGNGGTSLVVAAGASATVTHPITLLANAFGMAAVDGSSYVVDIGQVCRVVSIGNDYFQSARNNANGAIVEHVGDRFQSGSWVSGTAGAVVGPPGIKSRATATWNPGSIAAGATTSEYVTTGVIADLGDPVRVGFTAMADNLSITASVVAANVVKVYLTNHSGGAIDPASGTLTVSVFEPI